jgi:pimeloyl-ACP methyl ester carboxylesterase
MLPQTRYTKSGEVNIAYQILGEGPRDLVLVPGWVSNVELFWEEPAFSRFLNRLASFSRLILFDKRGTGLSDRLADMPSLELRMDDVLAPPRKPQASATAAGTTSSTFTTPWSAASLPAFAAARSIPPVMAFSRRSMAPPARCVALALSRTR